MTKSDELIDRLERCRNLTRRAAERPAATHGRMWRFLADQTREARRALAAYAGAFDGSQTIEHVVRNERIEVSA